MAFNEETLTTIHDALARSDRVDTDRVEIRAGADGIVLAGSVASAEEATAAAAVVERHAPAVDNRLRVDPGLREDTSGAAEGRPRTEDLTSDVEEALAENVAWDPPDEPTAVPTPTEQRGSSERDETVPEAAGPGEQPQEDAPPSAADLTQAELTRSARPAEEDERTDG